MQDLLPLAEQAARILKDRRETITVAESSTGGLLSAALLAVPGASAYFLGGAVVYTLSARRALMDFDKMPDGMRASTEAYALFLAHRARERFSANWALSETGASGPTGNRYGDAAGHSCIGVVGASERAITIETGHGDRVANMRAFSKAALELLIKQLSAA